VKFSSNCRLGHSCAQVPDKGRQHCTETHPVLSINATGKTPAQHTQKHTHASWPWQQSCRQTQLTSTHTQSRVPCIACTPAASHLGRRPNGGQQKNLCMLLSRGMAQAESAQGVNRNSHTKAVLACLQIGHHHHCVYHLSSLSLHTHFCCISHSPTQAALVCGIACPDMRMQSHPLLAQQTRQHSTLVSLCAC
jgi:hypothetical protein